MASSESLRQLHGEGMYPLVVLRGCGGWDSNKKTPYSGHSCRGFESRPGQSHAGPNLTWGQGDWKQSKRNRTQLRINVSSQRRQGPTWGVSLAADSGRPARRRSAVDKREPLQPSWIKGRPLHVSNHTLGMQERKELHREFPHHDERIGSVEDAAMVNREEKVEETVSPGTGSEPAYMPGRHLSRWGAWASHS